MSSRDDRQAQALAKPAFSEAQACAVVESEFGFQVSEVQPLPSYDDQNFRVRVSRPPDAAGGPTEYVLKISNTESSRNPDLIEVQSHVAVFLHEAGFPTASVCRTRDGGITSLVSVDSGSQTKSHVVRLLTYLPGRPVAEVPVGPRLLYEIGRLAATLDKTLEEFRHPKLRCLRREDFIWNLRNVPLLEKYLSALGPDRNREIVEEVLQLFKDEVTPQLSHFRECINHGDLNDHNILVESSEPAPGDAVFHVSGILDFEDMSYGYYVFEVAIAIMYMMIESRDPMGVGGHVLAGFESVIPLTPAERGALFLLVCGRFCQSLVMAAHSCRLHPENAEYLMITAKTGWKHLQQMFAMGRRAVEDLWFDTARSYASGVPL
ncbi:PREDICTED: hydroxylysine kinase [Myotis davidii]|uniref:Hydroxylysine kinase n=1 Tax=Myotis davidii TaxID=225400 RepID=L5LQ45_MYODS|nr:PREDICTED: hydroxylysine kinase [Myotis davidii]ELK27608.1 Aminoglycoside phosphotransferase domain-containing protein 1 [Myotis davidii]